MAAPQRRSRAFALCALLGTLLCGTSGAANVTRHLPQFVAYDSRTPRYRNQSGVGDLALQRNSSAVLLPRQAEGGLATGTCAPGTPCVNGACCNDLGLCGYSPDHCGADVCLSNCNAKAECGPYAPVDSQSCPLNVCCSHFGFCGSTEDFCTTSGDRTCQEGYGTCSAANVPSCSANGGIRRRQIGYYEGWSPTRPCDARYPEDLDLTALTHVYFSFAYIEPSTFQIAPMSQEDVPLYTRFTDLKRRKPSLETWIAVGGWAMNDPGNIPDTRTTFSDMARSHATRMAFIDSLIQFMDTYNFDGVDLDWEYPVAEDRGGRPEDTQNLVDLLRDMRQRFGKRYGISIAIPASYWYLRNFDVSGMVQHVDWLNLMSYDIHGVWDAENEFTGPYVRPHTNWTQIENGLSLLWRNDIDPFQVTLGIGWYGRSFTLEDPNCAEPGCRFAAGGNPGECTKSSGTLSNAEIHRLIQRNDLTPIFDSDAAVKWITWDNDQWISYDDGESTQLKIQRADSMCLGGTMIWAIDLDDSDHTSTDNYLGIGASNGVSTEDNSLVRDGVQAVQRQADISDSCYWTLCGGTCENDFFSVTEARGSVPGVSLDSECGADSKKTLCCSSGTSLGQCAWNGWRGVGMPCKNACDRTDSIVITQNTNRHASDEDKEHFIDETCFGGAQSYCCSDFQPSQRSNTKDLTLLGRDAATATTNERRGTLAERSLSTNECVAGISGALLVAALFGGFSLMAAPALASLELVGLSICLLNSPSPERIPINIDGITANSETEHGRHGNDVAGLPPGPSPTTARGTTTITPPPPMETKKGKPRGGLRLSYSTYPIMFPINGQTDCAVTYTCKYGDQWDEVCDNQRWGIDMLLGGQTIFHVASHKPSGGKNKQYWHSSRKTGYRHSLQATLTKIPRCQVDEFPMADLQEAQSFAPQVVRLVNGFANSAQGADYHSWKRANWVPCSQLRKSNGLPAPPITWVIGHEVTRAAARTDGDHFIQRYGFDSQTSGEECWATYSIPSNGNLVTVLDHGFRGLVDDPMFASKNWPRQNYHVDPFAPQPVGAAGGLSTWRTNSPLATDVASSAYMKRDPTDEDDFLEDLSALGLDEFLIEDFCIDDIEGLDASVNDPTSPAAVSAHITDTVATALAGDPTPLLAPTENPVTFPQETAVVPKAHLHRHQKHKSV